MQITPPPVTLICGIGSHARSVFLFFKYYSVRRIYIVYSQYNTSEFETRIASIRQEIAGKLEGMPHKPDVFYLQINERNLEDAFRSIFRIYLQNTNAQIITDLTAGHKIISYLLFYAHSLVKLWHQPDSKIIYLWAENDAPIELPELPIDPLSPRQLKFLADLHKYDSQSGNFYDEQTNKITHYSVYAYFERVSPLRLAKGTTHRYLAALRGRRFIGEKYAALPRATFYLAAYREFEG